MTAAGRWVADPTIGWRILLTATLPEAPGVPADRTAATAAELRRALVMPAPEPVLVGVAGRDLVVSAHHSTVDGLGLLRILEQLGFGPATSAARGVGDRPAGHGYVGTVARRLAEAAFRRPAAIPPPRTGAPVAGDTMVEAEIPGSVRTAEIIHAAGRAVAALGARRHVAVAVGATRAAVGDDLQDRSVLLRLRDVERLDLAGIERALREAPVARPPVSRSGAVDRVAAAGMRVLARRLGSTLLVSHLGEVTAPQVDRIAFHPVTAGGTGISLGAVGHRGRTVISLRARASDWDADGLERVLEAVVGRLVD